MEKIALLIDNLGPNQLAYLAIRNAAIQKHKDIIFFFDNVVQPLVRPQNAAMLMNELYGHGCVAIATNVNTAEKLVNIFGPTKKYFYVWDLEFVSYHNGEGQKQYARYKNIYTHQDLTLVARTEEYAKVLEDTFGCKVDYLMTEMDFEIRRR